MDIFEMHRGRGPHVQCAGWPQVHDQIGNEINVET